MRRIRFQEFAGALAIVAWVTLLATQAAAQTCTANWQSAVGAWSNGADWSSGSAPNSAGATPCLTNGTATVPALTILDISPAVHGLVVGQHNILTASGQALTIDMNGAPETLTNQGLINIELSAAPGALKVDDEGSGSVLSLNGGGAFNLVNGVIEGVTGDETVENVQTTIKGTGLISNLTLVNDSRLIATGQELEINANPNSKPEDGYSSNQFGFLNSTSGSVEVTAGSILDVNAANSQNAFLAVVNKGAIAVDGGGELEFRAAANQQVKINNTGSIKIGAPAGRMVLDGQNSTFDFGGFFAGSSTLNLADDPTVAITGSTGTETFENDLGSMLSGAGTISNLAVMNEGLIVANGVNSLTIKSNNGGFVNGSNGTVAVLPGSTLNIDMTAAQTAGFPVINEGTITVDAGAGLGLIAARGETVTIWNSGSIGVGSAQAGGTLDLEGDSATFDFKGVSGPGSITLSDNASNSIVGGGSSQVLINGTDETLSGAGTISNLIVVNEGTLVASGTNPLIILTGPLPFNNLGGTVQVDSGSKLEINVNPSFLLPVTLENSGVMNVDDRGTLELSTPSDTTLTVLNAGSINVGQGGTGAVLALNGQNSVFDFTPEGGSGSIVLAETPGAGINGRFGSETFINDAGETLSGGGEISNLSVVNVGTIVANGANPLIIEANPNTTNDFDSSPAGLFGFLNKGTVTVDSGSSLEFNTTASGGATFPVINENQISVNDGGTLQFVASTGQNDRIENSGTIGVGGTGSGGTIQLYGPGALFNFGSGGSNPGSITLSDNAANAITGAFGSETLWNNTGSVLSGAGVISNVAVENDGVIIASGGNPLTITPNANGAAELGFNIDYFAFRNAGTIQVDPGSTLNLNLSASKFAFFNAINTSMITVYGLGTLQFLASPGQAVSIQNTGTIGVGAAGPGAAMELNGEDSTFDFTGSGHILLSDNAANTITGATGSELLINDTGSVLSGAGTISRLTLENSGSIVADGTNALTIRANPNAFALPGLPVNSIGVLNNPAGSIQVAGGSTLNFDVTASGAAQFPVFNEGAVGVAAGGALEFTAAQSQDVLIGNTGAITVGGSGSGSTLALSGRGATFDLGGFGGLGTLAFSKNDNNVITGETGFETLINDAGSTLSGAATISHLAFSNVGVINSDGFIINPDVPSFTNNGLINTDAAGTLSVEVNMNNEGTINVLGGSSFAGAGGQFVAFGSLTNSGSIDVARSGLGGADAGRASVLGSSGMTNTGSVKIEPGAELGVTFGYTQSAGSTDVDGTLIASSITVTGGTFTSGGGVIQTQKLSNGILLTADSSGFIGVGTGPFTQSNGYQQVADGTLDELINGKNAFGAISVAGPASLAGTLDVTLGSGFIPVVGDQFAFLDFTPGDLTGTFSSFLDETFDGGLEKWNLTYDNAGGDVFLTAESNAPSPSPEPSSFVLVGLGLAALALASRQRAAAGRVCKL